MASNAHKVSIWRRHHAWYLYGTFTNVTIDICLFSPSFLGLFHVCDTCKIHSKSSEYILLLHYLYKRVKCVPHIVCWFFTEMSVHYDVVIMDSIASQITSLTIVYSTVHLGADQSKNQSSASLAFVWEIHRWPVNFPHKWPVTRKMFPFDDVTICCSVVSASVYAIRSGWCVYVSISGQS